MILIYTFCHTFGNKKNSCEILSATVSNQKYRKTYFKLNQTATEEYTYFQMFYVKSMTKVNN